MLIYIDLILSREYLEIIQSIIIITLRNIAILLISITNK